MATGADYATMNQTELIWALEEKTGEARRSNAQPGDVGMGTILGDIQQILNQYPGAAPANPAGDETPPGPG